VAPEPTAPARAPKPRPEGGHGQWALGETEPLNANETFKREDDGLNVRARIENVYAAAGFGSIDPKDLRGRMRWWGLYTQRKPGIDGGKTGSLEPHELDDEYFMLRVRSDGGILSPEQLRAIADVSQEFGRDTADITDRQNVQLHWIRIEDVPVIWQRLEGVGLTTNEACGDTPRVVLGSPVAGVAADEIIDGTPAVEEIVRRYVGDPRFSNLPRKFKSAVSGSPRQDVAHEINDVSFIGVVHPEHGPGFDVYVGGGLSTNPMLAQRLGVWVPLDEVADVWEAVISVFRDYGYRRLRTRARLKFLVSDWGAAKVREVIETHYLKRPLLDGPAAAPYRGRRDHVGVYPQKDGLSYVGAAPTVGRVSGTVLHRIADLAEAHGSGRIRLTAQQKFVVLDVADDHVEPLVAGLHELGLEVRPSEFRRGTMACTGIEFCKLAIVETKANAASLVAELEDRLPTFDTPLSIHVNGCPNSCARIQVADIGLKGMLVTDDSGNQVEGFQVHLGGELGPDAGLGRKPRGLKVSAAELPDYVERVLGRFDEQKDADESFASWARRADEEALA
jgi:sulfite reductase (ferredoxin)